VAMTISVRQHLKHLIEDILARHTAAVVEELATTFDDEIEERVRNRVDDLRQQLEEGSK
jgi:hypothetical protein